MLCDVFGNSAQVKLLDFLIDHYMIDYNVTDLEEYTGISRPTLYKVIEKLLKIGIIGISRNIGKMKLYQISKKDIAKSLIKFDMNLTQHMIKLENPKK